MNNISVGDLVMVVKPNPCCNKTEHIGKVFVVNEFKSYRCTCGVYNKYKIVGCPNSGLGAPIECLKKIPPVSELKDTEIKEEMPC